MTGKVGSSEFSVVHHGINVIELKDILVSGKMMERSANQILACIDKWSSQGLQGNFTC